MKNKRIVITGMSVNTPLGDTLDDFIENLLAGRSAISSWTSIKTDNIYVKIGGDLAHYDIKKKIQSCQNKIPETVFKRLTKLARRLPVSMSVSMQIAIKIIKH